MYRDNELKYTTVRKADLCTRGHRPLTLSISSFLSLLSCLRPLPPCYPVSVHSRSSLLAILSPSIPISSLSCLRPFPSPRYPASVHSPLSQPLQVVLQVVISFIVEAFVLNIQTTEKRRVDQMSKPNDQDRDSIGEARLTQPCARG